VFLRVFPRVFLRVSQECFQECFKSVSKSVSRVFLRVFPRVFPDLSVESLRQKDRTWYCSTLCQRHLLRKAGESDDVRSRSHAYGRDKIDLTSLTVTDAVFWEVLGEAHF
jgi:hypothetical protein